MLRLLGRKMRSVGFGGHQSQLFRRQGARFASTTRGRLEGKVALITGGASGIGKATAHEFIQEGAHVVIADVNPTTGAQAESDLAPAAHFILCDVTNESHVAHAVDTVVARHGKLDIMYNNAGVSGRAYPPSIADLDLDHFDSVLRVNVRGTMAGIKHAARVMIPARSGSILCTASISGLMGGLGPYPYSISKFAVPGIVKSASSELCGYGVRVNCVSPAPIATPMALEQFKVIYPDKTEEELVEMVVGLGVLEGARCEEVDVAKAAVYLASDEAKYVTGHNLVVDGGFTSFKNLAMPMPGECV